MKFNQNNSIIQLCMQGMYMEATGNPEQAVQLFRQAWDEAANDPLESKPEQVPAKPFWAFCITSLASSMSWGWITLPCCI
ncbi:hypothetical protein [Mucilaginibacter litoreus]